jgi:lipopolysaccharide transport system ATP-binding protein
MKAIIDVRGLSKAYTISHHHNASYGTLRDEIVRSFRRPFHGLSGGGAEREEIWALKDVTFEVNRGEIVGIIGRNGAGKSTLLKILSRIVYPTTGKAVLRGRVSSLLEVGTGFHAELTGRENVYLNGAILGLTKAEITRRFDEIVEFAEIDQFLDTPVKFYSSGMYVRLAFAVAAHLDPEILLVDEVLAVGDAAFQRKSLGKMSAAARDGRTILFVSHNADAIASLCDHGIHLRSGRLAFAGTAQDALDSYRAELDPDVGDGEWPARAPVGAGGALVTGLYVEGDAGGRINRIAADEPIALVLEADIGAENFGRELAIGFGVDTQAGHRVFTTVSSWLGTPIIASEPRIAVRCAIPRPRLAPGRYLVTASISVRGVTLDLVERSAGFEVLRPRVIAEPKRDESHGPMLVDCNFAQIERLGSAPSVPITAGG